MKKLFSIDLRSLALFRLFIGIILIFDFFNRLGLTEAFYSDGGILNRWDLIANVAIPWKSSLLYLNGTPLFAYFLATIGIIASLSYTLGIRTKTSAFIAWILLISFQNRFPMVNHGGDNLLRILLFFSIFIPVNARYSFDAAFTDSKRDSQTINTPFSFLIFLQIFLMYWFTFVYKWHPSWINELDSLYFALNLDLYTTALGQHLLTYPLLLKIISFLTLWIEGLGPFLLLVPYKNSKFRIASVVIFWGLHLGILFTLHLGNFPWTCLALWIPILPSSFWDYLTSKRKNLEKSYTLFYDYDCGFCRRFCVLLKEIFFLFNLELRASNTSPMAQEVITEKKTWLLVAAGNEYIRYSVFTKLLDASPFSFLRFIYNSSAVKAVGNKVYINLSSKRFLLGSSINNYLKVKINYQVSKLGYIFAIFLICLSVAWNLEGYLGSKKFDVKSPFTESVFLLGLNQQWNMFAPKPMTDDGWYVIVGVLEDGTRVNPFTNSDVSFKRPQYLQDTVDGTQWRKFFVNLWNRRYNSYRSSFSNYLCRSWNSKHENKLLRFQIYFMLERTPKDQTKVPVIERNKVWRQNCFNK